MKKIILAGGSGCIGNALVDYYSEKANEIVILSRSTKPPMGNSRTVKWDGINAGEWMHELEHADLLVNLTGKNVNCRYTRRNKVKILSSRLDATRILGAAVRRCHTPPAVWIQCASATIYRNAEDRFMDEIDGELGNGFSVDVCKAWEQSFWGQQTSSTKKILLRIGIVLDPLDSAFPRLVLLSKFGLGGKQGSGNQMISWVHRDDVVRTIDWCFENGLDNTLYNCTSPQPVSNKVFMRTLQQAIGNPIALPAPTALLTIGAMLIGTETELILKSRWVVPTRLVDAGFVFTHPTVKEAIDNLMVSRNGYH